MDQPSASPNPTIALATEDLELVEDAPKIVVDLAPHAVRSAGPAQRPGAWLVVVVYAVAIIALALAIYERFVS